MIEPSFELIRQWIDEWDLDPDAHCDQTGYVAAKAAQWAANQELEACLRLVEIEAGEGAYDLARYIRAARRPEPMSLKKLALLQLDVLNADLFERGLGRDLSQIRHALEQIDD
jgi:hypothetical protein